MRIFLLDDEPSTAEFLSKVLRNAGHEVQILANLQEAASAIIANPPEAVLMDARILRRARQALRHLAGNGGGAPDIIILTGYNEVGQAELALGHGAYDYVLKPVEVPQLINRLRLLDLERALTHAVERFGREAENAANVLGQARAALAAGSCGEAQSVITQAQEIMSGIRNQTMNMAHERRRIWAV